VLSFVSHGKYILERKLGMTKAIPKLMTIHTMILTTFILTMKFVKAESATRVCVIHTRNTLIGLVLLSIEQIAGQHRKTKCKLPHFEYLLCRVEKVVELLDKLLHIWAVNFHNIAVKGVKLEGCPLYGLSHKLKILAEVIFDKVTCLLRVLEAHNDETLGRWLFCHEHQGSRLISRPLSIFIVHIH